MPVNIGLLDRTLRLLLALALFLASPDASGSEGGTILSWGMAILAGWLAITGIFRVCPIYAVFALDTCDRQP